MAHFSVLKKRKQVTRQLIPQINFYAAIITTFLNFKQNGVIIRRVQMEYKK
jgi:hypothetical protein